VLVHEGHLLDGGEVGGMLYLLVRTQKASLTMLGNPISADSNIAPMSSLHLVERF
jgi:hypothetical protein